MSQEGFSWNGPPTHLICLLLRISGVGWSSICHLGGREGIDNTDNLQCRLMAIRDSITLTQLRDLFDGMDARMKLVVKLQGGHIGK